MKLVSCFLLTTGLLFLTVQAIGSQVHAQQQLAMLPGMGMAAPMGLAAQGPFHPMAVAAAAVGMGAKPDEKNDDRNSSRASRPRSSTPETSQKRAKVGFQI